MTSQKIIKENNIKKIFNLVRKNKGMSRAGLAGTTGLSPTTVSSLVDELLSRGLIMETGTADISAIGRKPIMLEENPGGGFLICADLHKKGYNLGFFNLEGKPVKEIFVPLGDYGDLGKSLCENIAGLSGKCKYAPDKLLGICIGAPGIIDNGNRLIVSSTVIPVDESNTFMDMLEEEFPDTFIKIVNESSLSAYAERSHLKGSDRDNLIYIDIHDGIGAGIIINGGIYGGARHLAGEFGHISVDINGPVCECGARGCLEVLANIPALLKSIEQSGPGKGYPAAGDDNEKFFFISEEYKANGRYSAHIEKQAEYIAYGINNAINLLDPGVVVIGGRAAGLGWNFLEHVKKKQRAIGLGTDRKTKILISEFKGNPVTAGGAVYILDSVF
jgi:predicted NBD/HSP70 family sugar kinase